MIQHLPRLYEAFLPPSLPPFLIYVKHVHYMLIYLFIWKRRYTYIPHLYLMYFIVFYYFKVNLSSNPLEICQFFRNFCILMIHIQQPLTELAVELECIVHKNCICLKAMNSERRNLYFYAFLYFYTFIFFYTFIYLFITVVGFPGSSFNNEDTKII